MSQWINSLSHAEAKKYFSERAADLKARFLMLDLVESIYEGPGNPIENSAVSILIHAMYYLEDRIGYEMNPAPKGMVLLPVLPKITTSPL